MGGGAQTPEELETLFEDAVLMGDGETLAELFEARSVFAAGRAQQACGRAEIAQLALATLRGDRAYIADLRCVLQARDIALIVGDHAINVTCRGPDGAWRYAVVCIVGTDQTDRRDS